jgi:hypothetical protein
LPDNTSNSCGLEFLVALERFARESCHHLEVGPQVEYDMDGLFFTMINLKNSFLWLLAPAAFASTLTEPAPAPVISTACTVAGQPVDCMGETGAIYGTESVTASGAISVLGLNTANGLNIEAEADATAGAIGPGPTILTLGSSAIAAVNLDFFAATDGPERQGFATFILHSDGDHGANGGSVQSSFISGLGSCQVVLCTQSGSLVPFELGVPFEIGLSIAAYGQKQDYQHVYDGGSSDAIVRLQLFDANGTPVVIVNAPGPSVPEPGSWILAALGLSGLLVFIRPFSITR